MIEQIKKAIKKQFLADDRPWVITFSGGKDSTFVLVLIIEMLLDFKRKGILTKKVIVVSSNTKVEMPLVEGYLLNKLKQIKTFVEKEELNVEVKLLVPNIKDDYFVCLLGKGYPAPNQSFRWCTDRLKIKPATDYLTSLVDQFNSITIILGVRLDESTSRAESIEKRNYNIRELTIHEDIANAYVYSPIKNLGVSDLWEYLSLNDSKAPWGSHSDMMELYDKGSGEADCNIALNPHSSSCGKTRLGCWVCTVVEKDSSMENIIKDPKYVWMKPLNDYRNNLNISRYDHSTRRKKSKQGMNCAGAYLLETRKKLFENALMMEEPINGHMTDLTQDGRILSDEQIIAINEEWKKDGDYSNDALKIANKYGRSFRIENSLKNSFLTVCKEEDIDPLFFKEVLELNSSYRHSLRRNGIVALQEQLIHQYVQGVVHEDF